MFKSINEVEKFIYVDCVINEVSVGDKDLELTVEALIVKANNSQNLNYTDSYAADTVITVSKAQPVKAVKVGFRKYDANDNIIEDVADEELDLSTLDIRKLFTNMYLNDLVKVGDSCSICVTGMDDDPTVVCDSYELCFECEDVIMTWERYLNRVQY